MDLPERKSPRLPGFDYSQEGYYFITICTHDRQPILGRITDGKVVLSEYGKIVYETYIDLPIHNRNIKLDKFVIMANHVHGIIIINNPCRGQSAAVPPPEIVKQHGVSEIIRQLKTFSSRRINEYRRRNGLEPFPTSGIWQKSFYDRIIRNEAEYRKIWEYIDTNPLKWELDKYYL